jgi:hypothetical protein
MEVSTVNTDKDRDRDFCDVRSQQSIPIEIETEIFVMLGINSQERINMFKICYRTVKNC